MAAADAAGADELLPRPATATLAQRLCQRVLSTASSVDADAKITSVSRWDHDRATLVRIRSGAEAPFGIADALRQKWPLAVVSLVENVMEGVTEAQILVPSREEQHALARDWAVRSPAARRLRVLARCVALAAMLSFVVVATTNATR